MAIPKSRDSREVFYSTKLLGIRYHCDMRHCTEMDVSTGWLCYDAIGHWMVGFECPRDGLGGRWAPELQPLIEEVVQDALKEGFDIEGAVQARREEHERVLAELRKLTKDNKDDLNKL